MITVCLLLIMLTAYVQEHNFFNFMKITTEFTNFGCEFCLVSRPNNNNSHLAAFSADNPGRLAPEG